MRLRCVPTPEQRAALEAQLVRLQQPGAALELPGERTDLVRVTTTVASVHTDRFVVRARLCFRSGEERSYALKAYADDFAGRAWTHARRAARRADAGALHRACGADRAAAGAARGGDASPRSDGPRAGARRPGRRAVSARGRAARAARLRHARVCRPRLRRGTLSRATRAPGGGGRHTLRAGRSLARRVPRRVSRGATARLAAQHGVLPRPDAGAENVHPAPSRRERRRRLPRAGPPGERRPRADGRPGRGAMTGQERGPAPLLSRAETTAVLSEVLRRVRGADARLVDWTAERLKHGRHPVVRYDVRVTLGGGGDTRRYSWVGKFYRHDEAARRVADLVAALAPTGLRARGGVVIPAVLAYHSPHRHLFSGYELGQALAAAILQFGGRVVATLGRAVAAFHATPLHVATRITPQAVLDDLRSRIARGDDRVRAVGSLSGLVDQLERDLPAASGRPTGALLHGDLGPAHLLWRRSGVVMLDLDRCARGDPALDLSNLLAQLRRHALRGAG